MRKENLRLTLYKPLTNCVDEVVQGLFISPPHSAPNHIVVYGTNVLTKEELPFTVVLNQHVATYEAQAQGFGKMLKTWNVHASRAVLVINGTMPNLILLPVSVVLGMTRGGDYHQVIVDYKKKRVIASEAIADEDKAVCASIFLGQTLYKPELSNSIYN